jgi:hypothetical protein
MADEDMDAGSDAPAPSGKSSKAEKSGKGGGGKGGGKSAKAKRSAGAAGAGGGGGGSQLVLAEHPRAVRNIAQVKAWGGLAGFLLGGYLSLPTQTVADAGFRALVAGVVCYMAAWAAGVFVWRHLVVAELRHAQQEALATELAKLQRPDTGATPVGAPTLPRGRVRAGV